MQKLKQGRVNWRLCALCYGVSIIQLIMSYHTSSTGSPDSTRRCNFGVQCVILLQDKFFAVI